jgi:hypothetical protein
VTRGCNPLPKLSKIRSVSRYNRSVERLFKSKLLSYFIVYYTYRTYLVTRRAAILSSTTQRQLPCTLRRPSSSSCTHNNRVHGIVLQLTYIRLQTFWSGLSFILPLFELLIPFPVHDNSNSTSATRAASTACCRNVNWCFSSLLFTSAAQPQLGPSKESIATSVNIEL